MSKEVSFEQARVALMNSYNSQILTHAGYLIALTVGIMTLFSRIDVIMEFFNKGIINKVLCYSILSFSLSLIVYIALRLFYWTFMSSHVLDVTMDDLTTISCKTEIYGIQSYLLKKFMDANIPKGNLTFYARLMSKWGIAKSLLLLFVIFLLTILLIGFLLF
jgi:hypothetical protein